MKVSDLPLITVVSSTIEGKTFYFSLNNRRLYTLKKIRSLGLLKDNIVRVRLKAALPRERERYTPERCSMEATIMKEQLRDISDELRYGEDNEDVEEEEDEGEEEEASLSTLGGGGKDLAAQIVIAKASTSSSSSKSSVELQSGGGGDSDVDVGVFALKIHDRGNGDSTPPSSDNNHNKSNSNSKTFKPTSLSSVVEDKSSSPPPPQSLARTSKTASAAVATTTKKVASQQISPTTLSSAEITFIRKVRPEVEKMMKKGKGREALSTVDEYCDEHKLNEELRAYICTQLGIDKY